MNFLQDPRVRVVIVVIITTAIAISIGLLMSRLLTPPPKNCSGDTHLDENTNKCVPNCQDGYKNDPLTGECVINCPDGEVSSRSITGVTIPGIERCVTPCGSHACDPESATSLCQDAICYIPNCNTQDGKDSWCAADMLCGTDSTGKKKTTLPDDLTLDQYGCYKNTNPSPAYKDCTDTAKPNKYAGTGTYANTHVCCATTEYGKLGTDGQPYCCNSQDDVIINRQCCPVDQACPPENPTDCLGAGEVCTLEGPCNIENAIGQPGNYTGCCPYPTSEGECYNLCTYIGTSETGMAETCSTDADCGFKSGFEFSGISTAGGKCDQGTCKLYCGPADASLYGNIVCLNDDNSSTSTCIDTNKMCSYNTPSYSPAPSENNIYICDDDTTSPPKSYWKSSSGAPTLTTTLTQDSTSGPCSALSCLERTISTGMLSDNVSITISGKQKTIPKTSISTTTTNGGQTCVAKYECNKMSISTTGGGSVSWQDQTPPSTAMILTQVGNGIFNGSWSGGSCISNPAECKYLSSGIFAPNGTLDGITASDGVLSGSGCQPASSTNPNSMYPSGVNCTTLKTNNTLGGYIISPNYYCTSWGACCGEGGLISSSDYTNCVCLANATKVNGVCEYNTASNGAGIISSHGPKSAWWWPPSTAIMNAAYLSLENTMSSQWVPTKLGFGNQMEVQYSHAVVVMSYNGEHIGFNSDDNLGTVSPNNPINFYYTYYDGINVLPSGQIPIVKGFFRFGTGPAYDPTNITNKDLGRPVRVNFENNVNLAQRDLTWGSATQFDSGDILTLVKVSGNWYLAALKCFYWMVPDTEFYGIQDGDGKIVYGTYNSSTKVFDFITNDPTTATPIDLNFVFSAVPGASTNSDHQFLTVDPSTIIAQAGADDNFELTFSSLAGMVKSSV